MLSELSGTPKLEGKVKLGAMAADAFVGMRFSTWAHVDNCRLVSNDPRQATDDAPQLEALPSLTHILTFANWCQ
jgi:hypothetical protein